MLKLRSGDRPINRLAIVRPKPRHSGHAPSGLLKLKRPGVVVECRVAVRANASQSKKEILLSNQIDKIDSVLAEWSAVSIDSVSATALLQKSFNRS